MSSNSSISRVFMNGNSQAVRIPADFRLTGDRVMITRTEGGDLLIRSLPQGRGEALRQAFRELATVDPHFVAALEDEQAAPLPMQDREAL